MPENKAKNWPVNAPKLHHTAFATLRMEERSPGGLFTGGLKPAVPTPAIN